MRAKYGILDCDFYNFDETGFMMGVICSSMVVTRSDRRGKAKLSNLAIGNGQRRLLALVVTAGTFPHFCL